MKSCFICLCCLIIMIWAIGPWTLPDAGSSFNQLFCLSLNGDPNGSGDPTPLPPNPPPTPPPPV